MSIKHSRLFSLLIGCLTVILSFSSYACGGGKLTVSKATVQKVIRGTAQGENKYEYILKLTSKGKKAISIEHVWIKSKDGKCLDAKYGLMDAANSTTLNSIPLKGVFTLSMTTKVADTTLKCPDQIKGEAVVVYKVGSKTKYLHIDAFKQLKDRRLR